MLLASEEVNGALVLTPDGSITPANAAEFETAFKRALAEYRWIVVDLSHAKMMCSSAMGVIYHAQRQVSAAGGDVKLACAPEYIASMFELMFSGVFESLPTRDAAIAAFKPS